MTECEFLDKIKETLTEKNIRVTMDFSSGGGKVLIEKIVPLDFGNLLVINNKGDHIRVIPVGGEPVSHIKDMEYPYQKNSVRITIPRRIGFDKNLEILLPYLTSSHLKLWDEDLDKEYQELSLLVERYKKVFEEE